MTSVYEKMEGDYLITTNIKKMDIKVIHEYLSKESYWAKNIPLKVVERSMQHSFCFAVIYQNKTIGFARLVTDYATFAYLADVFILLEHRKKGLSKKLLEFIQANLELQGLRRWLLSTQNAHNLYEKFEWAQLTGPQAKRFMQKHDPNIYKSM